MNNTKLKNKIYKIIFESDTPAGKGFDLSVIVVMHDFVKCGAALDS